MHALPRHLAILSLILTTACSTVIEGSSQSITVASEPAGAQCFIEQAGDIVGRVTTPGTAQIGKSKNDLVISCSKEGYRTVTVKNRSDMAITSIGNMAFYQLSFLGTAVDSATGAASKYDSHVFVTLAPSSAPFDYPMPQGAMATPFSAQSAAAFSMQPPMPAATFAPAPPQAPQAANPTLPPQPTASNPAIHAAAMLAKAALGQVEGQQVAQLTYAEQLAEASRRPPFALAQ